MFSLFLVKQMPLRYRNIAPVSLVTDKPTVPTSEDLITHQRSDLFCASRLYYLESGHPSKLLKFHVDVDLFFLQDDLLYKYSSTSPDNINERFTQLIVPQPLVDNTLFQIHDSTLSGHPGHDRSLSQARRSYFCPSMMKIYFLTARAVSPALLIDHLLIRVHHSHTQFHRRHGI